MTKTNDEQLAEYRERLLLMDQFREQLLKLDPNMTPDKLVAFALDPMTFKYAHYGYLFDVWMSGRQPPKDHEVSKLVNELRDVATTFAGTEQLRARLAEVVVPSLRVGVPAAPESRECSECGSTNLFWGISHRGASGIQDGRHCIREISATFYLGCSACSHTLETVSERQMLRRMNAPFTQE